ncbi:MAG: threonine-phosphate decarboxylase CobD [Sulfurisoma sp.]|nr:threonine-phosphate decarboxylase CobD [Sulfurisoma sp.]
MLEHGGRLREAARRWGIPLADWLDLSTGIAPEPYPVPPPPAVIWQRLPEDEDGLEAAAGAYYGTHGTTRLLALPGSQAAIQALPRLLGGMNVAVIEPGYGEYAAAARAAGHAVQPFAAAGLEAACAMADLAILGNPNNPDGVRFTRDRLLGAARLLAGRCGWLVVDEAFIDAEPAESLADLAGTGAAENIVVLRSLGKFFGLAGARVGFVIAAPTLLERLREAIGPWAVAHPARWAARHALADGAWQAAQRERLRAGSARLGRLLREAGLGDTMGTALFRCAVTPQAVALHEALARRGVLVRRFDDPAALRFGLPATENDWLRLAAALKEIACAA